MQHVILAADVDDGFNSAGRHVVFRVQQIAEVYNAGAAGAGNRAGIAPLSAAAAPRIRHAVGRVDLSGRPGATSPANA